MNQFCAVELKHQVNEKVEIGVGKANSRENKQELQSNENAVHAKSVAIFYYLRS